MKLLKKLFSWLIEEIKQAFHIVKDNLFLIVGAGIFVYNYSLFRFRSGELCEITKGLKLKFPSFIRCYSPEVITILLVVGAVLVVIGILIIKERKK